MAYERDRSVRHHSHAGEHADELLDLRPVVFIPGEHVGRRGDSDHDWFDVTGGLEQLPVERGRLHLAAPRWDGESRIDTAPRDEV
jgi:hypothetical protein